MGSCTRARAVRGRVRSPPDGAQQMSAHYRSRRDSAGIGPHVRSGIRLVPLGELRNVHIADGEPDIRGWAVRTVSGREVGRVHELLADVAAGEVVMFDVDLAGSDRH